MNTRDVYPSMRCPHCRYLIGKTVLGVLGCILCGGTIQRPSVNETHYAPGKADPAEVAAYRVGGMLAVFALQEAAA